MAHQILTTDPEIEILRLNKESAYNFKKRRQEEWKENYLLYRDKIITNRLTQRQSVNIPLMKLFIRTLFKDIDDMPLIYFENLDNDKQAELFKNEYWEYTVRKNKLDLKDLADKKQVLLFGRSFIQIQVVDGEIKFTVVDPEDILIDRYTDPIDIHSARYLIHTNIFVPFSVLEANPMYDQRKIAELKRWFASEKGLIKSQQNEEMRREKQNKMTEMGVPDVSNPILGETYVELSLHFFKHKEKLEEEEEFWLYVEAENSKIIFKDKLSNVIGDTVDDYWKTHLPYSTWTDDIEVQDFWSDGIADMIRTPNKVVNAWFSQLVENRTLRSFGMHYYDSTKFSDSGYSPATFTPQPWGWYPIPGKPTEVIQKVDIPDLSESLDEIMFVINMMEKATGATATQQGVAVQKQITLGEVQLALGEAKERIKGWSKFYVPAWKERAEMFDKMIEAASDRLNPVKIYKQGRNTKNIFSREISPKDWKTKSGYQVKIWSLDEKNTRDTDALTKLNAVMTNIPENPKLKEIYQRKLLEFAGLSPDEINDVLEYENQKNLQINQLVSSGMMGGLPVENTETPQLPANTSNLPAEQIPTENNIPIRQVNPNQNL